MKVQKERRGTVEYPLKLTQSSSRMRQRHDDQIATTPISLAHFDGFLSV